MNWNGIVIGAAVFACIGIFHPLVINWEYRWGRKVWWVFLVIALLLVVPLVIGRIKRTKWEVIMHEHSKVHK